MSQANIQVKLPDGSIKDVPRGTTPLDIARSISPRLAAAALVSKIKPSKISPADGSSSAAQPKAGPEKAAASMSAEHSKKAWEFPDLSKPLEQDVELRL